MQRYPRLKTVVTGRQVMPDRADPLEYIYLAEERTHRRIRLQTIPFNHNRGPIKQFNRWVLPVSKHVEPYLYNRVRQLESCSEAGIINYLIDQPENKRTTFNISAERAKQARAFILNLDPTSLNGQKAIMQTPQLLKASQPMRSAYNNSDTLWVRLSDDVKVFLGQTNTIVKEQDFDRVLRRGTYELLIHASVGMLHHYRGKWQSLVLRVGQLRYTPKDPQPDTNINRMLPSFQPPADDSKLENIDCDGAPDDELDTLVRRQRELQRLQEERLQLETPMPDLSETMMEASLPTYTENTSENLLDMDTDWLLQTVDSMLANPTQAPDFSDLIDRNALQANYNQPPPQLEVLSTPTSTPPVNDEESGLDEWPIDYTQPTTPNVTPVSTRKRRVPTAPKKSRKTEVRFPPCDFTPLAHSTQL